MTKMEDNQNERRPKWNTTKMEDCQNGGRSKRKMTKMADKQNGRFKMKDDPNGKRQTYNLNELKS